MLPFYSLPSLFLQEICLLWAMNFLSRTVLLSTHLSTAGSIEVGRYLDEMSQAYGKNWVPGGCVLS